MLHRLLGLSSPAVLALLQLLLAERGLAETGCPEPVRQVEHDIRAKIQGQLNTIGRLGAAQVEVQTERTAQELLSKYPNADRLAVTQNLISVFCNQLLQSRTLSDREKSELSFRMIDKIMGIMDPITLHSTPILPKARRPPGLTPEE